MSRPIKHRAWDKVDKRMIVDEQDFIPLMVTNKGVFRLSPHHAENLWELMDTDRFELMQSTGLQDRNGKEIYEGDIVLFGSSVRVIKFDRGSFTMFDGESRRSPLSDYCVESKVEVIGNVHSHPHLLKGDDTDATS